MRILDCDGNSVDVLYVLLLFSGKYDFLPELYDAVGHEQTVKLLDIFAGATVRFPSTDELRKLASQVTVYLRIKMASDKQKPSVVRDLADDMMVTELTVRNIYDRVAKVVEVDLGLEVFRGKRRFRANSSKTSRSSNRRRKEGP